MSLKVIRAGVHDSIQDTGRRGSAHLGISAGGAMDWHAAQMANALLGKPLQGPVVELHFPASSFLIEQATVLCLTGADFGPVIDGHTVPMYQPIAVAGSSLLQFTGVRQGRWCYLSLMGALDLPLWLNSYSTHTITGSGGWCGSLLRKDAFLPFRSNAAVPTLLKGQALLPLHWKASPPQPPDRLGIVSGPEWGYLDREAMASIVQQPFTVSRQSDRMGYRLLGRPLGQMRRESLLSSAVSRGTLQLLPAGLLIALMADHQTTGGYPRIAQVITAHQPWLAQTPAGAGVYFEESGLEEAEQLLFRMKTVLADLQADCSYKMNLLFS